MPLPGIPNLPTMTVDEIIRWFHLLAAAVWIGGMITVAALVPVLRKGGADRSLIQAAARRFGQATWVALSVSVATGLLQLFRFDYPLTGALAVKLVLVGLSISLAFVHQEIARDVGPRARGMMEGGLLLLGLAILAAAVAI